MGLTVNRFPQLPPVRWTWRTRLAELAVGLRQYNRSVSLGLGTDGRVALVVTRMDTGTMMAVVTMTRSEAAILRDHITNLLEDHPSVKG